MKLLCCLIFLKIKVISVIIILTIILGLKQLRMLKILCIILFPCIYLCTCIKKLTQLRISRLTIVSREVKKKQQSELFTCSTALKLANTLAKLPLKLSLSYYRPTTFLLYRINKPRMEEIGATIPKYQPLRVLWCPLCDYARRTILSCLTCPFTRQLVPSLFEESISRSL